MILLRRALITLVIAAGALDVWFYRQWNLNPDGVSYLDLARAFIAHGPEGLVSGYWSPLYPAVIGIGLKVFAPNAEWTYPMVRFIGFGVYVLCVFAFDRLVRATLPLSPQPPGERSWTAPVTLMAAWGLFFMFVTQATGMHLVTPDIGVAAIFFYVAAELVELQRAPWTARRWLRFGAILALGYWWKAILFPVGGVAYLIAGAIAWRRRDPLARAAAGAGVFGAFALVVAIPVSMHVGRATFGETGRLNQLWYVSNAPMVKSLCVPPDVNLPSRWAGQVSRERVALARPLTCVTRDAGAEVTLPLWFDPSPWYANAAGHFDVRQTLASLRNDLEYIRQGTMDWAPASSIALALAVLFTLGLRASPGPLWPAAVLSIVPIGAYLVVYVELRHIVPFILTLALVMLALFRAHQSRPAVIALAVVAAGVGADVAWRLATQQRVEAAITVHQILGEPRREQESVTVARELRARGLVHGDRMATVNALWNADWAQRAGLVVRAYVSEYTYPVPRAFEDLTDDCRRATFMDAMRAERIKAVVLRDAPGFTSPPAFERLGETSYRVHIVGAPEAVPAGCVPTPTRSSSGTGAH